MTVSNLLRRPPPGPFRASFWKSAARGRRVTSALGLILLPLLTIVAVTGFLSYAAYNPRLAGNDNVHHAGFLHFYLFDWPTSPSWLYRLNQGLHVGIGVALVPIVLIKLWSVLPRLFEWPPVRSVAHALERLSLLALVGGILFELVTGLLNISNDYVFGFSFYTAHLYGAVVFVAGFVVHVSLKLPLAWRAIRRREKPADGPDELVALNPGPRTISRRGVVALAGGSSLVVDRPVRRPDHRWTISRDSVVIPTGRARCPFVSGEPDRARGPGDPSWRRLAPHAHREPHRHAQPR